MLRVEILKENEYRPVFYHDGEKVSPSAGVRILRENLMREHSIGALPAIDLMASQLGKNRSSISAWLQGKYLSTDSMLLIKYKFDL